MHERNQTRSPETVHCMILGLSTFLVGLYFGTSLPAGVDVVVLQTGLIGFLSFLGLTQLRTTTEPASESARASMTPAPSMVRSRLVERRLDRHVGKLVIRRIDRGRQPGLPVSVRKSSRTAGAVSTAATQAVAENAD